MNTVSRGPSQSCAHLPAHIVANCSGCAQTHPVGIHGHSVPPYSTHLLLRHSAQQSPRTAMCLERGFDTSPDCAFMSTSCYSGRHAPTPMRPFVSCDAGAKVWTPCATSVAYCAGTDNVDITLVCGVASCCECAVRSWVCRWHIHH